MLTESAARLTALHALEKGRTIIQMRIADRAAAEPRITYDVDVIIEVA